LDEISKSDLNPEGLFFTTPFQLRKRGVETILTIGTDNSKPIDTTLIRSIAKARHYSDAIKRGQSFEEIAATENLSKRRILQVVDLAFLAPDTVKKIVQGNQPVSLTAKWLGINRCHLTCRPSGALPPFSELELLTYRWKRATS